MTNQVQITDLENLDYLPYLDDNGSISEDWQGKIGVYAVFDDDKALQFVGYSRNTYLSLKQHLVSQPQNCHWFKVQTISRPSRTLLEDIKQAWIRENGVVPNGNGADKSKWGHSIDIKPLMSEAEQLAYTESDELTKPKFLKNVARRVEAEIKETLAGRNVQMEIRFNPKLKEQGILSLK